MLGEAWVCVSGDEHSGSVDSLIPTAGVVLKSGNRILPNTLQTEIANHWAAYWERRLQLLGPRVLVRMGDCIEGRHHNSTESWGSELDQLECIESMYAPLMSGFEYALSVNGTAIHVGEEGCADEALANRLGFLEMGGRRSNAQIRPTIAGALFDIAHEGPRAGKMEWTKGNQLRSFARGMVIDDMAHCRKPPRVIIRAHGHHKCHETVRVNGWKVDAFLTPAWKARDGYAHKVASHLHLSDIGGLVIHIKDGEVVEEGTEFDCLELKDTPEAVL